MSSAGADRGPDAQRLLSALSSPVRRDILWLIWDRELAAGEIAGQFDLTAPTISQHLAVLREAGLVAMDREGTYRRYRARPEALAPFHHLLGDSSNKWAPSARRRPAVPSRRLTAVEVSVKAPCDAATAFVAFTDGAVYSRWAGVPVTIEAGHFSATMEWGLQVRGRYDHVVEPCLIVMTWDFDTDRVPLPGAGHRAYLEIGPAERGCTVAVQQLVDDADHAEKMERVWSLMLSRFRSNVVKAADPAQPMRPRRPTSRRS